MPKRNEKPELARLVTRTGGILRRIRFRQVYAKSRLNDPPALMPQQCHLVMLVHERGSMTIRQLTEALYVNAPAASIMVDRLVDMGILTRAENPKDRREVLVRLSPDQSSEIAEIERQYLQTVLGVFEKIGIDHARMWGAVCQRIQDVLADELKLKENVKAETPGPDTPAKGGRGDGTSITEVTYVR